MKNLEFREGSDSLTKYMIQTKDSVKIQSLNYLQLWYLNAL